MLYTKLSTAFKENFLDALKELNLYVVCTKESVEMTIYHNEPPQIKIAKRDAFAVVKASGENLLKYLQGQVTQNITKLTATQGIYTVILNPQGKAVTDLYMVLTAQKETWAEVMFLCPQAKALALVERLRMFAMGYELRIGQVSSWQVMSVQGESVDDVLREKTLPVPDADKLSVVCQHDKIVLRMPESECGVWLIGMALPLTNNCDESEMERGRIVQGIPYFGIDWTDKLHPLNANLIERDGVDFDKGCYVGQEVTSRMHWRGGIKKKLYRVQVSDDVASMPCAIHTTVKVGELTSLAINDDGEYVGIALLPIEVAESGQALSLDTSLMVKVEGICGVALKI